MVMTLFMFWLSNFFVCKWKLIISLILITLLLLSCKSINVVAQSQVPILCLIAFWLCNCFRYNVPPIFIDKLQRHPIFFLLIIAVFIFLSFLPVIKAMNFFLILHNMTIFTFSNHRIDNLYFLIKWL
jgi:hypothetical protein